MESEFTIHLHMIHPSDPTVDVSSIATIESNFPELQHVTNLHEK